MNGVIESNRFNTTEAINQGSGKLRISSLCCRKPVIRTTNAYYDLSRNVCFYKAGKVLVDTFACGLWYSITRLSIFMQLF